MNWQTIISELLEAGMTQTGIRAECGCSQSSVSDLLHGKTKEPGHSLGQALVALHKAKCGRRRERAAA